MRAAATATTWRPRRPKACCARASARSTCRRCRTASASTTTACGCQPAPGRPRARLGAGAARARRPGLGGHRRLQGRGARRPARGQRHLRAVRAGALRLLHHRVDLRPADLPLAAADARSSPTSTPGGARNAEAGRASVLARLQLRQGAAHPDRRRRSIGPIIVHGAVEPLNRAYRAAGVDLPDDAAGHRGRRQGATSAAPWSSRPPSVQGSRLDAPLRRLQRRLRQRLDAAARRAPAPRGRPRLRAVSDHADWPGLQRAIAATGAERVIVTHGNEAVMVR